MASTEERFFSKVAEVGGCWEWLAFVSPSGYGGFSVGTGKFVSAHRWAYEFLVGPIPDGLQLDHLCRNRKCVNPEHLEPVTAKENVDRGQLGYLNRDVCKNGHNINDPSNVYARPSDGAKQCRQCNREAQARYKARKRAKLAVA